MTDSQSTEFEKKLDAYYIFESDTRRDLHGNVIDEDIYLAEEDCYGLGVFLESLDESSPLKCGEFIRDYGDEQGNHNQMNYIRHHVMPYVKRDISEYEQLFKCMSKIVTLAADRTSYWGDFDEEYPEKTQHLFYPNYIEETDLLCEKMESFSDDWKDICACTKAYIEDLISKRIM